MDKVINRYIREKFSTSVPYTINIELTQSCPLNCPECYQIKENSQEIEMSLFRSTISEAAAIGVSVILLSGGDPLMFSQIESAVEIVKMHNMICYLSSSGCGLTEELAHRLSRAGLDAFHVSLNGSTEQVNSLSRAGFEHAITALNILRSAKCTLPLYDKNTSNREVNQIGHLNNLKNDCIDRGNESQWLSLTLNNKKCNSCKLLPICINTFCPYKTKFTKTAPCYFEEFMEIIKRKSIEYID